MDTEEFGGKGPIVRGDSILPGDTVYTTHLRLFICDSIRLAFDDNNNLDYYIFITSRLATVRGIRVGDSREKLLQCYPPPTTDDGFRFYDELAPDEDKIIQYSDSEEVYGIAFFLSKGRIHRIYIGEGAGC